MKKFFQLPYYSSCLSIDFPSSANLSLLLVFWCGFVSHQGNITMHIWNQYHALLITTSRCETSQVLVSKFCIFYNAKVLLYIVLWFLLVNFLERKGALAALFLGFIIYIHCFLQGPFNSLVLRSPFPYRLDRLSLLIQCVTTPCGLLLLEN